MRFFAFIILATVLLPYTVYADQPEAREIARNNNCPPKKIDVYQQSLGSEGKTVYLVQCTMPKTVGDTPPNAATQPTALLISCDQSLCELLRPVTADAKK